MAYDAKTTDFTVLYNVADAIIQKYKDELIAIDARGSGDLIKSIDYDIVEDDGKITLQLTVLDYYYYIEYGRGPSHSSGWEDPIEDLTEWLTSKIRRGKLVPRANKPVPTTQKDVRRVALAVYRKITEKGYYGNNSQGKHPLQKSLEQSLAEGLVDAFANAFTGPYKGELVTSLKSLENRTSTKSSK